MIRKQTETDLTAIMQMWLETNTKAHSFIPEEYWLSNYEMVKSGLPKAEVFVYEDDATKEIYGFIGLMENYIAGLFVKEPMQANGIGSQLIAYAKSQKEKLTLEVYQKNMRAVQFYHREGFSITDEAIDENTAEVAYTMSWQK